MNGSDWDVKGLPASTPQQQSITEYAHYKNTQHYQYYPHNIVYGISANHMVYLWPLRAAISASKRQNWGDAGFVF